MSWPEEGVLPQILSDIRIPTVPLLHTNVVNVLQPHLKNNKNTGTRQKNPPQKKT